MFDNVSIDNLINLNSVNLSKYQYLINIEGMNEINITDNEELSFLIEFIYEYISQNIKDTIHPNEILKLYNQYIEVTNGDYKKSAALSIYPDHTFEHTNKDFLTIFFANSLYQMNNKKIIDLNGFSEKEMLCITLAYRWNYVDGINPRINIDELLESENKYKYFRKFLKSNISNIYAGNGKLIHQNDNIYNIIKPDEQKLSVNKFVKNNRTIFNYLTTLNLSIDYENGFAAERDEFLPIDFSHLTESLYIRGSHVVDYALEDQYFPEIHVNDMLPFITIDEVKETQEFPCTLYMYDDEIVQEMVSIQLKSEQDIEIFFENEEIDFDR